MRRLVPMLAALAVVFCSLCASAGAARFYMPHYGGTNPEMIGGFDLGADGSLAPLPYSPFPGGESTGGLVGLAFTPDGSAAVTAFLFTGGVQGYSVPPSGPFGFTDLIPAASTTGEAITPDGRFAYAGTREFGGPAEGILRLAIGAGGSLTKLSPNAGGSEEFGDLAITPDGKYLFAAQLGQVQGFAIGADGSLSPLGATPVASALLLAVSPDGRFLFLETDSGMATLAIKPDGQLEEVGPPLVIPGFSARLLAPAPDGRHVYLADYNHDAIATVAIAEDGTPTFAGETPAKGRPESVAVSPDGRYLVYYEGDSSGDGIGAASIAADGSLTVLPSFVPWNTGEPERLVFQPQPTPVARFSATTALLGQSTRFDAGASERAVRYEWNFGDGNVLADGGPTPAHTYSTPGTHQVTLVVTDAQGCSLKQVYTGQSTVCPGGPAARTVGSVNVALGIANMPRANPRVSKLKVVPKAFAPKVRGAKSGKVKLGTTFRYRVSEAATVRFKIERKKGKRFKKFGSRPQAAKAGANKLKWNGKLKGKPLPPGRYRATVVATDKEGGRSLPKTVGFRILPVPPPR
ncbi:MAG TPA: PKD domain-containing protein [Solirubrobacterales bacterium]|nr:PKD domain-containing protein [Solirubrobacterales bacterium]